MQPSPLQLRGYFLRSLRFALNDELETLPNGSVEFDELTLNITANTTSDPEDSFRWRSELLVESVDEPGVRLPYTFGIVLVGFFHVHESYPKERVELLAKTNSPALLYSAAREVLATVTRRGPYVPVLLPSITFLEPPKEEAKPRKSKASTNGGRTKVPSKRGAKRARAR